MSGISIMPYIQMNSFLVMIKNLIQFMGILLLLCLFTLPLFGCDGFISVKGTVYEWIDAPTGSTGDVYVDIEAPDNRFTKPIEGVIVNIYGLGPNLKTDSEGTFKGGCTTAPTRFRARVEIEKEGYKSFTGYFQHPNGEDFEHTITVFLVTK